MHISENIRIILLHSHNMLDDWLIQNIIYNNTVLIEKEIYGNVQYLVKTKGSTIYWTLCAKGLLCIHFLMRPK